MRIKAAGVGLMWVCGMMGAWAVEPAQLQKTLAQADAHLERLTDPRQAWTLYEQAARRGSAYAAYQLSLMAQQGIGHAADPALSLRWLERGWQAADGLHALVQIAERRLDPQSVWYHPEQALVWLKRAAQAGDVAAQNKLGDAYLTGRPGPVSLLQAVKWYGKAAAVGSAEGQYGIGLAYLRGRDPYFPHDPLEGAVWIERAAAQGYAPAQILWSHRLQQQGKQPESYAWWQAATMQASLGPADHVQALSQWVAHADPDDLQKLDAAWQAVRDRFPQGG